MKTYRLYEGKEDNFQISVAKRLKHLNVNYFHVGNERKSSRTYGGIMKAKGVKRGVSDVIILTPKGIYHGFICELKTQGNKLSEYQFDFLTQCDKDGYFSFACWSIDEFDYYIDIYMNLSATSKIDYQLPMYKTMEGKLYEIVNYGLIIKKLEASK